MSREDDLMTLIDFCNEMATSIRSDWSDPRSECRAIWDAHDMGHVVLGGDRVRNPWGYAHGQLLDDPEYPSQQWPDVRLRMTELHDRLAASLADPTGAAS